MGKKVKPALIPVEDLSSSEPEAEGKQVVSDSEESYEEFGEDEIDENEFAGRENESSVSDIELSSSDEDIQMMKKKLARKQAKNTADKSDEEEVKEPKDVSKLIKSKPDVVKTRDVKSGEVEVNFELVQPSEAYYHQVKALILRYLDGAEADELDVIPMADHICERVSIGQVVASPLEPDQDPEQMPELAKLSDADFAKVAVKYNSQRDVFGFSTILSLTYKTKTPTPKFIT
jgi:phage terminase Nu1 subunit (DNA packaging protein)